jgi:hypothetical protein
MTLTVWLFFIFGPTAVAAHQVVDNFPTLAACESFRANVQQMQEQFGVGRVSECLPRSVVK